MKTKEIEQRLSKVKECIKGHEQHGITELWDEYKELKQERKQLKQQLKDLPCLEVGRWYKTADVLYCLETLGGMGYGFDYCEFKDGEFFNDHDTPWVITGLTPATDSEVEEALIKEAKKRGFKEGVEYKFQERKARILKNFIAFNGFASDSCYGSNYMCNGYGDVIFKDGKWAEIIQTKTVELNGNYTEVQLKDILHSQF